VRLAPLLAAVALAGLTLPAAGAELYGRPLRGLSAVPIAELAKNGAAYEGKTIRVKGSVVAAGKVFRLAEGPAEIVVTMRDGSALPPDASGAAATAEGTFRAKGAGGGPALDATGVELTR
jgi:putative intracellular protease/amidase